MVGLQRVSSGNPVTGGAMILLERLHCFDLQHLFFLVVLIFGGGEGSGGFWPPAIVHGRFDIHGYGLAILWLPFGFAPGVDFVGYGGSHWSSAMNGLPRVALNLCFPPPRDSKN